MSVEALSAHHEDIAAFDGVLLGVGELVRETELSRLRGLHLLLWQEAGDLVGVATLGSCSRGVSPKVLRYLLGCPRLLVAYDVDAEGERGAEQLGQLSPRMRRIRPPMGKDVTALWQAGGRVRDWVQFELARLVTASRTR